MMLGNKSPLDLIFDTTIDHLDGDICTKIQFMDRCQHTATELVFDWERYFTNALSRMWEKEATLDPKNRTKQIRIDNKRYRVRIMRRAETWQKEYKDLNTDAIKLEVEKNGALGIGK